MIYLLFLNTMGDVQVKLKINSVKFKKQTSPPPYVVLGIVILKFM
jgi:hypothetical protein